MRDIEQRIEVVAMVRLTHTVFPQRADSVAPRESCGHRLNRAEPVQAEAPRAEMDTPTASGCE